QGGTSAPTSGTERRPVSSQRQIVQPPQPSRDVPSNESEVAGQQTQSQISGPNRRASPSRPGATDRSPDEVTPLSR
ncbi:hypothetical protein HDU99_004695, partial [Rhizoclosmatium hyalinum]